MRRVKKFDLAVTPRSVFMAMGEIGVSIKTMDEESNRDTFARFSGKTRQIEIQRELAPNVQRQAFIHEWVHAVLWDAGVHNSLTKEQEEAICDAIATCATVELMQTGRLSIAT